MGYFSTSIRPSKQKQALCFQRVGFEYYDDDDGV